MFNYFYKNLNYLIYQPLCFKMQGYNLIFIYIYGSLFILFNRKINIKIYLQNLHFYIDYIFYSMFDLLKKKKNMIF
jgi:hypothetical protein